MKRVCHCEHTLLFSLYRKGCVMSYLNYTLYIIYIDEGRADFCFLYA